MKEGGLLETAGKEVTSFASKVRFCHWRFLSFDFKFPTIPLYNADFFQTDINEMNPYPFIFPQCFRLVNSANAG